MSNAIQQRPEPIVEPFRHLFKDDEHYDRQLLMSHLCAYRLAAQLGRGRRMLEVGCGSGYGAYYLSHSASAVTAVDMDPVVINRAQGLFRRPNLAYQLMDARGMESLADASFDVVGTFQVIEHIPEPELLAFVRGIARVLRPDGVLIVSTLNLDHNRKPGHPYEKPSFHEKEFTAPELQRLLSEVFPAVELRGLYARGRYRFMRRLKKWGINKLGPVEANPVRRFYDDQLTTDDHELRRRCSPLAIDLIAACAMRPQAISPRWDRLGNGHA
jgi:SAM-dependent methyltransferase